MAKRVAKPASSPARRRRGAGDFHGEVGAVFGTVRRRLGAIVEGVCGGSPRAQDVTDAFGVYRKLGWQIWNVVYTDDPLAATRYLPAQRSMRVWRAAAEAKGVAADALARLDEALGQFHQAVERHAGDREMLEVLVEAGGGGDGTPDEAAEARWRKQAFAANAFIWGVRAHRLLAVGVVAPSTRAGYFDLLRIQGLFGLVRTRASVRWPFAQLFIRDRDGNPYQFDRRPLDEDAPAVRETGVPLLPDFCSRPLPPVQRSTNARGVVEDELLPGPVGQRAAANIVTGEILREVAPLDESPGAVNNFGTGVRTPGELLVSDLLLHRDLLKGAQRELCVFGELVTPLSRDERDRIPVADRLQALGPAAERIATADVPRYDELVAHAMSRVGWDMAAFDLYRVRMRYPPIPVSVVVRSTMPAGRNAGTTSRASS